MPLLNRLDRYKEAVSGADLSIRKGRVTDCHGLVVEAVGPMAYIGETCEIFPFLDRPPVLAEVVGLRKGKVLLMPSSSMNSAIRPRSNRLGLNLVE